MKTKIVEKADRILHHLFQESQSEVGLLQMVNPVSEKCEWLSTLGMKDIPDSDELYQSLIHEMHFRNAIKNKSIYVMEIKKDGALRRIYGIGIRYGLVIPFYQKNEWTGFVFLGSYFVYPKAIVDQAQTKVATFADFVTESETVPDRKNETFKKRLKRYEQSVKALFQYNPDVIWWMDTDGTILSVNSKLVELTGFQKTEVMNRSFDQFVHMKDLETAIGCFVMAKKRSAQNFEGALRHQNGHFVEVNITFVPVMVDYKIVGVYGIAKDISERKRVVAALQESHDFTSMILESIRDGFLAIDKNWRVIYWNKEVERITGIHKERGMGTVLWELFPQMVESVLYAKLHKVLYEQVPVQFEYYAQSSKRWYVIHGYPAQDGLSLFIHDMTKTKKAEQQIARMKDYDKLTGLPNPELFKERLKQLLNHDSRRLAAIMFVQIDGIESAGGLLGFGSARLILNAVSDRLTACLQDAHIITRYEGYLFGVLIQKTSRSAVEFTVSKMIESFQHPLIFEGHKLFLTPVIGISICPDHGTNGDELLARSEVALRCAKEENAPFHFYNEKLSKYKPFSLLKDMQKAYEEDEFKLVYQPQVDLRTGSITGVEALLRWEHPEYGMIPPDEFIYLAEESGLIIPIGRGVLEKACIQAKQWQDRLQRPIKVSVNLSPVQLIQPQLVQMVRSVLSESGLSPQNLDLEITESMTADVGNVIETLEQLKSLGVKISIDDFGKEYSSLHYLKRLPLDAIKIDRLFIKDCTKDENDAMLVKTIISMAHHMNLNVIAEGVETVEQLVFLQQNLCDEVQGYLFSRPVMPHQLQQEFGEIETKVDRYGIGTEQTNQIWIEEQLRATRQDLKDVLRKQQGMTFKFREENGRFVYTLCDGELLYRFGLTPAQVVGNSVENIIPQDLYNQIIHDYKRAWLGEKTVVHENMWNGIGFLTSLRPILRGGKVMEVIGNCVDITDRMRVEKALRESEERYRQLVELSPDIIMVHDQGKVLFVNRAGLQAAGDKKGDLLSSNLFSFLSPKEHRDLNMRSEQLVEGKKLPLAERKAVRADGETHFYEVNAVPIQLKGKTVVQSIVRDITERKRQEQVIRELDAQYRLIAKNMSDLIAVFDANWDMIYASPSHELVLGYPADELDRATVNKLVHPDDAQRVSRLFSEMEKAKTPKQLVFRYKHRAGKWVYVESKVTPVLNENKDVDRFIIVSRDVTEWHKTGIFQKVRGRIGKY